MEWINIKVSSLRDPSYIGSTPTERATWFNVLGFSVEQENSGRILGGASWKDRQWQQTCGVTLREVRAATKLLTFQDQDVFVWAYPLDTEEDVQNKQVVCDYYFCKRFLSHP